MDVSSCADFRVQHIEIALPAHELPGTIGDHRVGNPRLLRRGLAYPLEVVGLAGPGGKTGATVRKQPGNPASQLFHRQAQ
jgi:hypothetical protein